MSSPASKPAAFRRSGDSYSTASHSSSLGTASLSIKSALKKPFQGWTREALWAKDDLDDVYNFPTVRRRGAE